MPLRPVSRAARWVIGSIIVTATLVVIIIEFTHRWSLTIATPPDELISFVLATTNTIKSSPLLLCLTVSCGLIGAAHIIRWMIGPNGLQTPE